MKENEIVTNAWCGERSELAGVPSVKPAGYPGR